MSFNPIYFSFLLIKLLFFQPLTLLNFTPLIDIYLAISQHSAIFPYHPIPLFWSYTMRTLKSTIKFLCKVEWKCVQVIKNFIFQSLTIQKMCLTYHINTDDIISIIVKITESFWPYFTRFLLETVSTLFTIFLLKQSKKCNCCKL